MSKTTSVWYYRNKFQRDAGMGFDWLKKKGLHKIDLSNITKTHAFVKKVDLAHLSVGGSFLEGIFVEFQAEHDFALPVTTPVGRGPEEIGHTSMSVGDIVEIDTDLYFCDVAGWEKLPVPEVVGEHVR